jgi:hypothetical protein
VKQKNFAVIGQALLQGTKAILVETCFLDNAADMAILEENRKNVATAICRGVCAGLGIQEATPMTARRIVQEKAGLEDKTMDYLAAYQWGMELLEKLAKAMQ